MNAEHLYEYAVLRYVPRAERGEFVNIGLAMMCKRQKWLRLEVKIDVRRISALGSTISIECLRHQLKAFEDIAAGLPEAGLIARCPVEERFRWLTAAKSACIRTSPVHPGLTSDLAATFRHIFAEQVE